MVKSGLVDGINRKMSDAKHAIEKKESGIDDSKVLKKKPVIQERKKAIIIAGASLTMLEYDEASR
jgi:hypothetical protein